MRRRRREIVQKPEGIQPQTQHRGNHSVYVYKRHPNRAGLAHLISHDEHSEREHKGIARRDLMRATEVRHIRERMEV